MKKWLAKAFNTSILQKSRLAWVDYLRGIAIVLVTYRHVLLGLQNTNLTVPQSLVTANMIFFSFRMPLFFILSGIFINGSLKRRSLGQVLFTRFENLLYPYFIWSFIQVTLQILLSRYSNTNRTAHDYLYILYQPRALDQFWYLPALFNTTLVYLLLKVKAHVPSWAQLILGLVFYLLAPHIDKISMLSDWMQFYIFYALGDNVSEIFFRPKVQGLLNNPWTLPALTPVFIASQIYYVSQAPTGPGPIGQAPNIGEGPFLIIALIGCLTMFALAFRLQKWDILRFLRVLGFHSLYIYVIHVLVAAFVRAILMKVFGVHNSVVLLACGILAGVTVPVVFYNLCVKDNFAWFLFSLKKPDGLLPATNPTGHTGG